MCTCSCPRRHSQKATLNSSHFSEWEDNATQIRTFSDPDLGPFSFVTSARLDFLLPPWPCFRAISTFLQKPPQPHTPPTTSKSPPTSHFPPTQPHIPPPTPAEPHDLTLTPSSCPMSSKCKPSATGILAGDNVQTPPGSHHS